MHLHTRGDPQDTFIAYTPEKLIDTAVKLKFDVLAITCHNKVLFTKELAAYARKRNILLIPGVELTLEKRHVLIYNITEEERKKLKTFDDLYKIKDHAFITAPHPYFHLSSVGSKLEEYHDAFDAVEYSHFYCKWINANNKGVRIAKQFSFPVVGNSDAHHLETFNTCFSLIDAQKTMESVFSAIRKNKVKVKTQPMSTLSFLAEAAFIAIKVPKHRLQGIY